LIATNDAEPRVALAKVDALRLVKKWIDMARIPFAVQRVLLAKVREDNAARICSPGNFG
jgi:hypothetical protein